MLALVPTPHPDHHATLAFLLHTAVQAALHGALPSFCPGDSLEVLPRAGARPAAPTEVEGPELDSLSQFGTPGGS